MADKREIKNIACVGEVMIELIVGVDGETSLGVAGDTFNTAVYMVKALSHANVNVSYVTALGSDPYSDRILKAVTNYGLATDYIEKRDGLMPGLYAINTDPSGERSFNYWRSTSAARTLFAKPCNIELSRLNDFDLVYLSGITMAILNPSVRSDVLNWAGSFCAAGGTLVYDSNHRPHLWESTEIAVEVNEAMWTKADIALPSLDDEMLLFGDPDEEAVLARLAASGAQNGALKRGALGPRNLLGGTTYPDLPPVRGIIDSTAAGDSFNAGYLAAIILGHSDITAMHFGHKLASRVVQARGAIVDTQLEKMFLKKD